MKVLCIVGLCVLAVNAGTVREYEKEDEGYMQRMKSDQGRPAYPENGQHQHGERPYPPPPYPMQGNYPPPYPQHQYDPQNKTEEGYSGPPPPYQGHPGFPRGPFPGPPQHGGPHGGPPHHGGPLHHMPFRPPGPPPPPPAFVIKEIISNYCKDPVLQKCLEENLEINDKMSFLDTPEVIALNTLFIRAMGAKKVLDIGCFTGASSLAAALALPQGGKVVACDVSEPYTTKAKAYWKEAKVQDKIELVLAPALETLKKLVAQGEAGTFDFAFVDHDLLNYDHYYELCLKLVRRGGMIAFDSRLRMPARDKAVAKVLQALNEKMDTDKRVTVNHFNIGEGLSLVFIN